MILLKKRMIPFLMVIALAVTAVGTVPVMADYDEDMIVVWVAIDSMGEKNVSDESVEIKKIPVIMEKGDTASDAFEEVLDEREIDYEVIGEGTSAYFDSIIGLGWNADTGKYWDFSINGTSALVGAGGYSLYDGDTIAFCYKTYADELPYYLKDDTSLNPQKDVIMQKVEKNRKKADVLAAGIYEKVFDSGNIVPDADNYAEINTAISLLDSGFEAEDFYDAIAEKLIVKLSDSEYLAGLTSTGKKAVTLARAIEFLSKRGYDCTYIYGNNVIAELLKRETYDASYYSYGAYGYAGYMLQAIDAAEYMCDAENTSDFVNRDTLINAIIDDYDNGIEQMINWSTVDTVAMDLETVAPYTDRAYAQKMGVTVSPDKISTYVDSAVKFICNAQEEDGAYKPYGISSYNSLGVVMIALSNAGIDLTTEVQGYDVIKNGNTLIDVAAAFVDETTGSVDESVYSWAPEQLLEGMCLANSVAGSAWPADDNDKGVDEPGTDKGQSGNDKSAKKVKLSKAKIKKAVKSGKKIKITLTKKVKNSKGYSVRVFKSKKDAKKNNAKKALYKKDIKTSKKTFVIKNGKFKKNKKLYVRVRAYTKVKGKKVHAKKWSEIKKVS